MNFWRVETKNPTTLRLWPSAPGRYRITDKGPFVPLLSNGLYFLLHKKYAVLFDGINERVLVKPAIIFDPETGTEHKDYAQLCVYNHLVAESLQAGEVADFNAWKIDHHLFVSDQLKKTLMRMSLGELCFHKGFYGLGA